MKITGTIIIFVVLITKRANSIWPPAFQISLNHEETFVISDNFDEDDKVELIGEEDEMIKFKDVQKYDLEQDAKKYSLLHQLTLRKDTMKIRSIEESFSNKDYIKKPKEEIFLEDVPWEAGFVDKNGQFKQTSSNSNHNVKDEKRETKNKTDAQDYDYKALKEEYSKNLEKENSSNNSLNHKEINEEDSVKEVIQGMVNQPKKPKNCTNEEIKGIGLTAVKCIFKDLKQPNVSDSKRKALFRKIGSIIALWIIVYLLVAIPCWCQRGWCCCCFQCKFCKPQEKIDIAKKFLLDNPIGVYHVDNKKVVYKPTDYEKYAQQRLEKNLMTL